MAGICGGRIQCYLDKSSRIPWGLLESLAGEHAVCKATPLGAKNDRAPVEPPFPELRAGRCSCSDTPEERFNHTSEGSRLRRTAKPALKQGLKYT